MGEKSYAKWRCEEGAEIRARVVRVSQLYLTCAVLDSGIGLRTSEILPELEVVLEGKRAYCGRAIVSSSVNAGTETLCELRFDEPGLESPWEGETSSPDQLAQAYVSSLRARQQTYKIGSEFKLAVIDVESFLVETRGWLERVLAKSGEARGIAVVNAIAPKVIAEFNIRHARWEELAAAIEPAHRAVHEEFVRHHWHPLFLCCPFGLRTFRKPLGYAGDYEMMNMIHRNAAEGDSPYARLIHRLLVSQWPAQSVRNRIAHLKEQIISEIARVVRTGRRAQILNIGCGPAWEVQEFMGSSPLANHADFTLVDFNQETLEHVQRCLIELRRSAALNTGVTVRRMSVQQLLSRTRKGRLSDSTQYDLVYCAGLFDYLSGTTCKALLNLFWDWLSPGGSAVVANMDDPQPFRSFIEFVLDWHLIYRHSSDLMAFCTPDMRDSAQTVAELTSVNIFLHIRKQ